MPSYGLPRSIALSIALSIPLPALADDSKADPGEPTALDSVGVDELMDMDLESILNMTIESVSKKTESLFDSALSSDTVTRDMIKRSGARSIMEALRLVPGLIVREQTAGNFDIHIRGLDNVPPHSMIQNFASNTVLVMIDYRVVYNYFMGGTFWETLPIEVDDVERIEVVRGPSSALYGPNAVSGVINIITRDSREPGFKANIHTELGPFQGQWAEPSLFQGQWIANASIGYSGGPFRGTLSTNYQEMARSRTEYYGYVDDKFYDDPSQLKSAFFPDQPISYPELRFPEPDLALRRCGANGFFAYEPNDQVLVRLSGGFQNSRSQKIYADLVSNSLTTNDSQTYYADARSRLFGAVVHVSYQGGTQVIPTGVIQKVKVNDKEIDVETYNYDLKVLDTEIEYEVELFGINIRPGLSYRWTEYDGVLIAKFDQNNNIIDSSQSLQNLAGAFRADTTLFNRLRLIAALRLDYYPNRTEDQYYPIGQMNPVRKEGKSLYLSFQFASTFKFNDDNLIRAGYSRSISGPFLLDTYINEYYRPPVVKLGNRAVDLLTMDMVELGYRARFLKNVDFSLEVFGSYTRDFPEIYLHVTDLDHYRIIYQFDNLDDQVYQMGATASVGVATASVQARAFFTLQETRIYNHAPYTFHLFDFTYNPRNPENQVDLVHKGTPDFFGGFYLDFRPIEQLKLNLNAYYFSRHTQIRHDYVKGMFYDAEYRPAEFPVQASFLLNLKVGYQVFEYLTVFVNARNVLNLNQRQFFWGDVNHAVYMIGMDFAL